LEQKVGPEKAHALMKYEGVATLSKIELTDIINTMWPGADKASPAEVKKAILLCSQYGLNPLANHLYLIPFKTRDKKTGQVVKVTYATVKGINARRLIARRKHSYSEINDTPRYMTEEEEKRAWKTVNPDEIRFIVTLRDTKTGATASGYGHWPKWKTWTNPKTGEIKKYPNEPEGIEKGNSPENMAAIRAERIALDKLYPADMPNTIPYEDEFREKAVKAEESHIDKTTGEIVDGEFTEEVVEEGGEPGIDETGFSQSADGKLGEAAATLPAGAPAEKAETVFPSAKQDKAKTGGKPTPEEVAYAAARDQNMQMIRTAANKSKWDQARLLQELKERTKGKYTRFEDMRLDELQEFASKVVDLSELA